MDTPVLIVGAGPVGLGLALDLGHYGVEATIVERTDGSIIEPKIGVMAVRTMELFRRWGIARRVRECGFPDDYELSIVFCTSITGHELAAERYPSIRDLPTPAWSPERKQRCPQMWLNPILQEAVAEQPSIDTRLMCEVTDFTETPTHVVAHVRDHARQMDFEIRCRYLVACDGAGSAIRERLGIGFSGGRKLSYSLTILVRCEDFLAHHDLGQAERYIFVGPQGTWGNWTVVDGTSLWRLTILGTLDKFDLSALDARAYVRMALGRDLDFEIVSISTWRRSEMIADSFRSGRVFLAGDSAHTMSPTGGMGMNTGMCEAADLGWKLRAVLNGWSDPSLLDTYQTERLPIAVRNAAFSTHNFKAWQPTQDTARVLDEGPEGDEIRRRIGLELRESTRVDWEPWGLQMGYRYEGSPIVIPDGSPPTPDDYRHYVPTARPGSRAPHAWRADGSSLIDAFGRHFTLLCFVARGAKESPAFARAAAALGLPLDILRIDETDIATLYEAPFVLVRPDGHVAWRGEHDGAALDILTATARARRRADTIRAGEAQTGSGIIA